MRRCTIRYVDWNSKEVDLDFADEETHRTVRELLGSLLEAENEEEAELNEFQRSFCDDLRLKEGVDPQPLTRAQWDKALEVLVECDVITDWDDEDFDDDDDDDDDDWDDDEDDIDDFDEEDDEDFDDDNGDE